MNDATERWLPVVGYEGLYEVSDLGRIRSLDRPGRNGRHLRGRPRKGVSNPHGYLRISLWGRDGQVRQHSIHRLVLHAFAGDCPEGMETRHLNGDPSDCRLENLAWGTPSENAYDRRRHGTIRVPLNPFVGATHCINGHEFTEENTYQRPYGGRDCRTCRRAREARWRARKGT